MSPITCVSPLAPAREDEPEIKVQIFYEDFPSAVRAMRLLTRVCRDAGHRLAFEPGLWNFQMLHSDLLRRAALESARHSELVVVAAHGRDALPPTLKTWLESWRTLRCGASVALVELLDGVSDAEMRASTTHAELMEAARRSGAEFFACAVGPPPAIPPSEFILPEHGIVHWGINE